MCRLLRVPIRYVDIGGDELYRGQVSHGNPLLSPSAAAIDPIRARLRIEKAIMLCLAGPLAQRQCDPHRRDADYGGTLDIASAMQLATDFFHSRKIAAAYINFATEWVRQKWADPRIWAIVERLAHALVQHKKLSGRQVSAIIRGIG